MTQLADLRKSYERAELDESASHADPLQQFDQWLKEAIASEVPEPNAMTVATVASNLRPSTRVVLIKGYDAQGITWFTNYNSRKGRELANTPFAALQFHWVELERVVRIEGAVEKVSDEESDAYFASRARMSQVGAWASRQSQTLQSREAFEARLAQAEAEYAGREVPRPAGWSGFRVVPSAFEFWYGAGFRLHERWRYDRADDGGWSKRMLYP